MPFTFRLISLFVTMITVRVFTGSCAVRRRGRAVLGSQIWRQLQMIRAVALIIVGFAFTLFPSFIEILAIIGYFVLVALAAAWYIKFNFVQLPLFSGQGLTAINAVCYSYV